MPLDCWRTADVSVHSIRLAGPWETIQDRAESQRVTLPYSVPDGVDSIILRRRFHRPSGLENDSLVRIVLTTIGALSHVTINDRRIELTPGAQDDRSVFDITDQLNNFNCLEVTIGQDVRELRSAVLEIFET